jgi:hypothetical protein
LNEPVELLQAWGSDMALEYACNNLIRGAHHMVPAPVFRYLMSQGLILYRNWVNVRMSRGLGAERADFKQKERMFMYKWQRALTDIKESVRLASKSESKVIKFNAKSQGWQSRVQSRIGSRIRTGLCCVPPTRLLISIHEVPRPSAFHLRHTTHVRRQSL